MGEEQMKEFFAGLVLSEILHYAQNDRRKFQNDKERRAQNDWRWRAQNLLVISVQPILSPSFMELSLAGVRRRR